MIHWNNVFYIDCMDKDNGLPSLPDKSIDLCITDPPYNINFKGSQFGKGRRKREVLPFKDDHDFEWNKQWFRECERVCNTIVFTCGTHNLNKWLIYKNPTYQTKYHYKSNGPNAFHLIDPILCYGKNVGFTKIRQVIDMPVRLYPAELIHPSPKVYYFWYYLINKLNPKSVIDPFLGSGTTAEVCTKLGIKWIGYELNMEYSHDINLRLTNCKKEPKQTFL